MADVLSTVELLGRLPASFEVKAACVRSKVLPASLYGCQSTHLAKAGMNRLGSAILAALFPGAAQSRARALAQAVVGRGTIDPEVQAFTLRVVSFRRAWAKHEAQHDTFRALFDHYATNGVGKPMGPVGLLLGSI
eukprot:7483482-Alexandrium_andersonii.AAC.1